MTNTQLKAQIDTQITNETVDFGITPQEVGNNIKAVVDYADQQDALKVDKVAGERLINTTEITKLSNQSGTNTGDETTSTIKTKLGITTLSGSNTGDQDLSGKEDISNKSISIATDGASNTKYPSVKAVKDYVDANVGSATPEFKAQMVLNGVNVPSFQKVYKDTFQVSPDNASDPNQRIILLSRNDIGQYELNIYFKNTGTSHITDFSNLEISLADARTLFKYIGTSVSGGTDVRIFYQFEVRNIITGALEDPTYLYANISIMLHQ